MQMEKDDRYNWEAQNYFFRICLTDYICNKYEQRD